VNCGTNHTPLKPILNFGIVFYANSDLTFHFDCWSRSGSSPQVKYVGKSEKVWLNLSRQRHSSNSFHSFQYFGQYIEIFWKIEKYRLAVNLAEMHTDPDPDPKGKPGPWWGYVLDKVMSIRSDADPQYCQIRVVHCSYNHDVWAWASSSKFLYDGSRSPGRSLKRSSFSEKKGKLMPYRYRPYCS
jgi:hypothetical protein